MFKKVLAVDNDPFMLEFYRDALPKDKYEVLTAEDGLCALDILHRITPDVIFVDLVMPGINGKKLCKTIRSIERLKNAYLIILSATVSEARIDVETLGVNACIAKGPMAHMRRHIREVLDHPEAATLRCSAGECIGAEQNVPRAVTRQLLHVERHFEHIMDVLNEGVVEVVSIGSIIYANKAGISLLGVQETGLLGSNFFEFFSETDKPKVLAACENSEKPESANRELLVHLKGRQVMLKVLPVVIQEGVSFIFLLEDVTERRRTETQLVQAKKSEALSTLSGGIAHNFNNLLFAIQGNVSLLKLKGGMNREQLDALDTVEQCVDSASKLTSSLLQLAKGSVYELKTTDLNEIIRKSSDMFRRTTEEVCIHEKCREGLWVVEADPGQLEQVLLNLYRNAVQAMPSGGDLYIESQNVKLEEDAARSLGLKGSGFVKITVRDTGMGMHKKTQERIFDPFFTTKKPNMGTGLGLSTVYNTIKDHKGMITVQSERGKGALFSIFLPVAPDPTASRKPSIRMRSGGKGSILFVEDEAWVLDTGKQMLEQLGYCCLTAPDGQSALEIYREQKHRIDMVILDMVMPGMGGGEIFDRLMEVNPEIKVLLSSGYGLNGEASEILERGCSAFIQKPFSMNELSQKIEDLMTLN
jgi:two-component system cell cycle sensor histidine kinase/response regulator CckA